MKSLLVVFALLGVLASPARAENCTHGRNFWQTHGPGECNGGIIQNLWPVTVLGLGNVEYSDLELCAILLENPEPELWGDNSQANGLLVLAHQLIVVKLNIANGADDTAIGLAVQSADALIGSLVIPPVGDGFLAPIETIHLALALADYNLGITGPGPCGPTSADETSWGRVKALYR